VGDQMPAVDPPRVVHDIDRDAGERSHQDALLGDVAIVPSERDVDEHRRV
jgi:hypothetical protein